MAIAARTPLQRYGFALLVTAAATVVSVANRALFEPNPFLLYFLAVTLAAAYGGLGGGLLSAVGSVLAVNYFMIPPYFMLLPLTANNVIRLITFFLIVIVVSVIHETRTRAEKDKERALRQAYDGREQLRVTLASIGDGVLVTDAQGRIGFVNEVAEKLTGWSAADAHNQPLESVFRIVSETTRQPVENPYKKVMQTRGVVGLANHTTLIARDGREHAIDDSGAPIRDEAGSIVGVVIVFRDISARRHAEQRQELLNRATETLASSLHYEQTLQNIANLLVPALADWCSVEIFGEENIPRQITVQHTDPEKVAIARMFRERYPITQENMPEPFRTGKPQFLPEIPPELLQNSAMEPEHQRLLIALGLKSSMTLPLVLRGRVLGAVTLVTAESGRRYNEDDLAFGIELVRRAAIAVDNALLYSEAQRAIRDRDDFMSIAAHELKTPVTSLRGFAEMLLRQFDKRGTVEPKQLQRALQIIDQQSVKLSFLLTRLLELSRLESGRLMLERAPTDLYTLISDVITVMQRNTLRHAITFEGERGIIATVDALRLEQVLINLLDNAIKYSPNGGTIDVRLTLNDPRTACFTVTDHGVGIAPERRKHIFERYYQAHGEGYQGGMGLGLYVSSQIVDLHGGRIEVDGAPGGGTQFIVLLPLVPDRPLPPTTIG